MLTPAQAAFLAALPQRPTAFNPVRSLASAQVRQRTVLRRMAAAGALNQEQLREALAERLAVDRGTRAVPRAAFRRDGSGVGGHSRGPRESRRRWTSSSSGSRGHHRTAAEALRAHGAANVAVVVLDNASRRMACVGGLGQLPRRRSRRRDQRPARPAPAGLRAQTVHLRAGFRRRPYAGDRARRHPVELSDRRARRALQSSQLRRPVPRSAARATRACRLRECSRCRARLRGRRQHAAAIPDACRLHDLRPQRRRTTASASRSGNAEVRLDQLVAAYATFARGGDVDAADVSRHDADAAATVSTLVSPRTAFWITDILTDAEARAFIFGRGGDLEFPFPVAVKTGTSQAYHDNWTIGYTRDVTVGVWVGNFDRTPLADSIGRHRRRTDLSRGHARRRAPCSEIRASSDRIIAPAVGRSGGRDLRAFGHAGERLVSVARDRMAAGRRGTIAMLVASPE